MHRSPFVSIIITAYNKQSSIDRCITSAIDQSYRNLEIIVVDDCSTDGTLERIKAHSFEIKIIANTENIGHSASRLVGLKHCSGEYITYLDGDDYLDRRAIETAMRETADVVQMEIKYRFTRWNIPLPYPNYYYTKVALEANLYNERVFPVSCWGKLYRRQLLENAKLIDYDGFWGEDRLLNLAIFEQKPTIALAFGAIYNYSYGGESTKTTLESYSEYAKVSKLKHQWAEARGLDTKPIEEELQRLRDYHISRLILSGKYSKEQIMAHIRSIVDTPAQATKLYRRNLPSLFQRLTYQIERLLQWLN